MASANLLTLRTERLVTTPTHVHPTIDASSVDVSGTPSNALIPMEISAREHGAILTLGVGKNLSNALVAQSAVRPSAIMTPGDAFFRMLEMVCHAATIAILIQPA
jgi:hypothetical protein